MLHIDRILCSSCTLLVHNNLNLLSFDLCPQTHKVADAPHLDEFTQKAAQMRLL